MRATIYSSDGSVFARDFILFNAASHSLTVRPALLACQVEEMLTPERADAFAFSRPVSAADATHVENLYLSDEFKRDQEKLVAFLSEAGTVLKRSTTLGAPTPCAWLSAAMASLRACERTVYSIWPLNQPRACR